MHPRKKQIVKAQGGIPAYPARFRYEPFTVFATFLADGLRELTDAGHNLRDAVG